MRSKEFLSRLDHKRIVATIASSELKTSGEIRLYIQRGEIEGDAAAIRRPTRVASVGGEPPAPAAVDGNGVDAAALG
jgi:uncharacterized membrane protein